MDQVKTVTKWIKKIKTPRRRRESQEKNETFPLFSSFKKRQVKARPSSRSFGVRRSKNLLYDFDSDLHIISDQEKTTDNEVEEKKTLKKVIKDFLSPSKNRSSEKKNKSIKQFNEDSKSSQAPEFKQIASISMSSLLVVGNFSTSSPVFNRKTFDKHTEDFKELDNKLLIYSENHNIETYNDSDAGAQVQDDENTSGNESPVTPTDLVRSNSDSEILPLIDTRDSDEDFCEFTRNDLLRHSYPGSCNSTRRESCQRMLRCVLENMANNMFDDQYNHSIIPEDDSLSSEIQRCFDSFDESITPDDSFTPKKTMRETLLEISSRRKSLINKEMIFCPMKSPRKKNNGDHWKLKRLGHMSNVISPKGFGISTMNISEEKEEQLNDEIEEGIIRNNVSVNNDEKNFDSTPRRRSCFEDSYIYNSNNSLIISTYV